MTDTQGGPGFAIEAEKLARMLRRVAPAAKGKAVGDRCELAVADGRLEVRTDNLVMAILVEAGADHDVGPVHSRVNGSDPDAPAAIPDVLGEDGRHPPGPCWWETSLWLLAILRRRLDEAMDPDAGGDERLAALVGADWAARYVEDRLLGLSGRCRRCRGTGAIGGGGGMTVARRRCPACGGTGRAATRPELSGERQR